MRSLLVVSVVSVVSVLAFVACTIPNPDFVGEGPDTIAFADMATVVAKDASSATPSDLSVRDSTAPTDDADVLPIDTDDLTPPPHSDLGTVPTPHDGPIACNGTLCDQRCCLFGLYSGGAGGVLTDYMCQPTCGVDISYDTTLTTISTAVCRDASDCVGLVGSVAGAGTHAYSRCCHLPQEGGAVRLCTPDVLVGLSVAEADCQ